ncbi:DUF1538 family protein [Petrotoga sp. 9PWA.NaAc.5.4]|uniref:DUF1538 family protein n=1 Tax=Petrotoga sp. 9PWA.NaAc.5.4 TaxID=1434328 RepID=UPI0011B70A5A|nr:DUF1538 family protein [Petrotoga sp. 9PWA.NaAc.5.4]
MNFTIVPIGITLFKLSKYSFLKIIKEFVYTFIGAILLIAGAHGGFMDIGAKIGTSKIKLTITNGTKVPIVNIPVAFSEFQ